MCGFATIRSLPLSPDFRSETNFTFRDKYKSAAATVLWRSVGGIAFPSSRGGPIGFCRRRRRRRRRHPKCFPIPTAQNRHSGAADQSTTVHAQREGGREGGRERGAAEPLSFAEKHFVKLLRFLTKPEGESRRPLSLPLQRTNERPDRIGSATSAKGFLSPSLLEVSVNCGTDLQFLRGFRGETFHFSNPLEGRAGLTFGNRRRSVWKICVRRWKQIAILDGGRERERRGRRGRER